MIAVIFEVEIQPGRAQEYFNLAAALRPQLEKVDGFISVERFESLSDKGRYLSLSLWRDEEAVAAWKAIVEHQAAQRAASGASTLRSQAAGRAMLNQHVPGT